MVLVPNYVPTDWVDNVTPVDEARMDHIEGQIDLHADAINTLDTRLAAEEAMPDVPTVVNGQWIKGVGGAMVWSAITIADVANLQTSLNAKQDTSAKGAVNGYASLDSGGKVPTTQLPVSIDLRWAGAYAGATAYKEGDVVTYNGISYMALRPSTGETPAPWSTSSSALATYSTVLGSDFGLASGSTFQDITGMVLTSLPAGTYLIVGAIEAVRGANAGWVTAKVWDGTAAPVAAGELNTSSMNSGQGYSIPLIGLTTLSATTTLKVSVAQGANGHTVKASSVSGGNAPGVTNVVAVKLA